MSKIIIFIVLSASLMTSSCNQKGNSKVNSNKNDSLTLTIRFEPAFEERSEIELSKTDYNQSIQILIKNNVRVDKSEDTFWFKRIYLTDQQYAKLDSTLIKQCQLKVKEKQYVVMDGMGIFSLLANRGDTNVIYFHSPNKEEDSIGYNFSKNLFEILKPTFHDTLVSEYLNDIEEYIDESKIHLPNPERKIDQMRIKKYKWIIQRSK